MGKLWERFAGGHVRWTGYLGDIRTSDRRERIFIELTAAQAAQVDANFDPSKDHCSLDTAVRLFPHLALRIYADDQE